MKTLTDEEIKKEVVTYMPYCVDDDMALKMYEIAKWVRNEIEKRNRWIPCSERLPEKEGRYLICFNNKAIVSSHYSVLRARFDDEFTTVLEITAWKELPEPFKD